MGGGFCAVVPGAVVAGVFPLLLSLRGSFFSVVPRPHFVARFFLLLSLPGRVCFFAVVPGGPGFTHSLASWVRSTQTSKTNINTAKKRVPLKCLEGDQSPCLMRFDTPSQEALSLQQQQ